MGIGTSMKREEGLHYVYILRCADDTLYTGWTPHLEARLEAHNKGTGSKYTRGRGPVTLVYYETFQTKPEALKREWEIKRWNKKRKLELIQHQ